MKVPDTWKVVFSDKAKAEFGSLTNEAHRIVIQTWLDVVEANGPFVLRVRPRTKAYRDHRLDEMPKWVGCRASWFSLLGRIIYRVDEEKQIVEVVRITPIHNYE